MLRLFRNYLCLAALLQFGVAAQAQQHPLPSASKTVASNNAPASKPGQASLAKTVPVAAVKAAKSEAAAAKIDAAGLKTNAKSPSVIKIDAKAAAATKADPKAKLDILKSGAKSTKTANAAKPEAKSTKTAESKTSKEVAVATEKSKEPREIKHSHPRFNLVPPPPPDTPTVFAGDGIFPPNFGVSSYGNPAALAGRRKDLASQLASAKKVLQDKEQRGKDLQDKSTQFQQLFSEGVISRRELESAQKDVDAAVAELNDARMQVMSLQNAVTRIDARIKPKSVAASKKSVKVKASAKARTKIISNTKNESSTATAASTNKSPANTDSVSATKPPPNTDAASVNKSSTKVSVNKSADKGRSTGAETDPKAGAAPSTTAKLGVRPSSATSP